MSLPSPARRWNKVLVLVVVLLGVGLGASYATIPEPPPRPTPLPTAAATPVPIVPSLDAAVGRDVVQLANTPDGLRQFLGVIEPADREYADWYNRLLQDDGPWGRDLYAIERSGTLAAGVVWVDVQQFRRSNFYRQTRFYELIDGEWQWTLPDAALWSGEQRTIDTAPINPTLAFTLTYPVEEADHIRTLIDRFARTYTELCIDLNCRRPPRSALPWPDVFPLEVVVQPGPEREYAVTVKADHVRVRMPSLRIMGQYVYPGNTFDPVQSIALDSLIGSAVRAATGRPERWRQAGPGQMFLQAAIDWQRRRVARTYQPLGLFFKTVSGQANSAAAYARQLAGQTQLTLTDVWNWSGPMQGYGTPSWTPQLQAETVLMYIGERYDTDGVVRFINALGAATSLDDALSDGLGVDLAQFERDWRAWLVALE